MLISGPLLVDYSEVYGQKQRQFTALDVLGPSLTLSRIDNLPQMQGQNDSSTPSSIDSVEFGFDLSKICFHYKHRMSLRNEAPIFDSGDIITLHVKDEADYPLPHITAFARVWRLADTHDKISISPLSSWSVQELDICNGPDICIVVTSFSQKVENFYVDLSRLKPWFDISSDGRKVYHVRETIESPQIDLTVSSLELQVCSLQQLSCCI
jgi:hypothetical protein